MDFNLTPEINDFNHHPLVTGHLRFTAGFSLRARIDNMEENENCDAVQACYHASDIPYLHEVYSNANNGEQNSCTNPLADVKYTRQFNRQV